MTEKHERHGKETEKQVDVITKTRKRFFGDILKKKAFIRKVERRLLEGQATADKVLAGIYPCGA